MREWLFDLLCRVLDVPLLIGIGVMVGVFVGGMFL